MGLFLPDQNRRILPRWRSFAKTAQSDELANVVGGRQLPDLSAAIDNHLKRWTLSRTVANAIEVVNACFVAQRPELAIDAADFLLREEKTLPRALCELCLKVKQGIVAPEAKDGELRQISDISGAIRIKIAQLRMQLGRCTENPVKWVELAWWHNLNGNKDKAERAMRIALQLAPYNRFVLRSAVRLCVHLDARNERGLLDMMHAHLVKCPALAADPWLLGVELSLSELLGRSSKYITRSARLVQAGSHSSMSLAELTSALGTQELLHGSSKQSKRYLRQSLVAPNENVIAQAEWATQQISGFEIDPTVDESAHEAKTLDLVYREEFELAYPEAVNWILDQPFSREPVVTAGYVATMMDDSDKSLSILEFGLKVNPGNFTLLNNKAYDLAVLGRQTDARLAFSKIDRAGLNENERIVHTATMGMLDYMSGQIPSGETHYNEAIRLAQSGKNKRLEAWAKFYKLKAECLSGSRNLDDLAFLDAVRKDLKPVLGKELDHRIEKLKERLAKRQPQGLQPTVS